MLERRIELWWEPTRAPLKSENKSGGASVAPDFLRSCRLVFRAMRKIQHAEAELYQAFFTHRFCGRALDLGSNKKDAKGETLYFDANLVHRRVKPVRGRLMGIGMDEVYRGAHPRGIPRRLFCLC